MRRGMNPVSIGGEGGGRGGTGGGGVQDQGGGVTGRGVGGRWSNSNYRDQPQSGNREIVRGSITLTAEEADTQKFTKLEVTVGGGPEDTCLFQGVGK